MSFARLDRRTVIKLIGSSCVLGALEACTYADIFTPPPVIGGEEFDLTDSKYAALKTIGEAVSVDFPGRKVNLIRINENEILCVDRICTHLDCDMKLGEAGDWRKDEGENGVLACICHNSFFTPQGEVISGPATRPLPSFEVDFDPESGQGTILFGGPAPVEGGAEMGGEMGGAEMGGAEMGGQPVLDVPAEYADLTNPFADDAEAIAQGEVVYAQCAGCHGSNGEGTQISDPPPTAFDVDQSNWSDGYLFWRLREGGASGPSGSIMPAYPESSLSDDQVWQVISYLRSLEP